MTHTTTEAIALARVFAAHMQEALSRRQFLDMNYLNKVEDNPLVCHSHDHCDANMVMLAAFTEHLGREPAFLDTPDNEADRLLWNDAWAIAKAAGFDF